jgi:hypothetical protein
MHHFPAHRENPITIYNQKPTLIPTSMSQITPFLMFEGQAERAMHFSGAGGTMYLCRLPHSRSAKVRPGSRPVRHFLTNEPFQ